MHQLRITSNPIKSLSAWFCRNFGPDLNRRREFPYGPPPQKAWVFPHFLDENSSARRFFGFTALLGIALAVLGTRQINAAVSVTQGHIAGTISFDADFVPDSMDVDAANPLSEPQRFNSHTSASFISATPMGPGRVVSAWGYNIDVEAALTTTYYVRPTAYIAALTERAPFPDFGTVTVSAGLTTPFDISYRPVILTGTIAGSDMNNQPLSSRSFFLNAFDTAPEAVQPDCGGSINFCGSASQVQGVLSTYKLYLKPGHTYILGSQALTFNEAAFGSDAYNAIDYNYGEPFVAPASPGAVIVKDYVISQKASVSGQLQLNVPAGWQVLNKGLTVSGQTLQSLAFSDRFSPATVNPAGSYVTRLFDFTDFSKAITISPLFTVTTGNGQGLVEFPQQQIAVASGDQAIVNFSGDAGVLSGKFTFFPPYRVQNAYPNVQVETLTLGVSQNAFVPDPVNGGTYSLLAFPGSWSYWRFGWTFDMGNPNFTASYIINNFLSLVNAQISGLGDVAKNDFLFNTAFLKVFYTAPDASGLSDPWLDAVTQDPAQLLAEHAHGEGLNQTGVLTGEARLVLRVSDQNTPLLITPSAILSGSRVTFSPFTVTPHAGEIIVVGTPANILLTVTSPQPGQTSGNCQYTVAGTAGGTVITSITVNGQAVPFVAAPTPGNPNGVTFNAVIGSSSGSITITATDVQNHQISATIPVVCLNQPPVVQCAAPVVAECGSSIGNVVTLTAAVSDPDLDPLTVVWSVDGAAVATNSLPSGATSASLTRAYSVGVHAVKLVASDGRGGVTSCSTTATIQDTTPPTIKTTICQALLWPADHDLINVGLDVQVKDGCDCGPAPKTPNCDKPDDKGSDKGSKGDKNGGSKEGEDDHSRHDGDSDHGNSVSCDIPVTVQVFSNEDDQEDTGTGNFSPDARDIGAGTLRLRSERKGNGKGRVYLIVIRAADKSGNTAVDCATVVVPHDMSSSSVAAIKSQAASAAATLHSTGVPPVGYFVVGDGPKIGPKQ